MIEVASHIATAVKLASAIKQGKRIAFLDRKFVAMFMALSIVSYLEQTPNLFEYKPGAMIPQKDL